MFLTDNDEIRIGDLGVAKVINDHSWFAQTIVGTPYYLSPELCEEKPYNEKSDIWALGCVLYELCAGRQPFKAVNQAALALKIIKGKYDSIPLIYSKSLSEIIAACLTKDYRKRPSVNSILGRTGIFPLYIKQIDVMDKGKSLGLSYEVGSININARPSGDKPTSKMFEMNDHVGSGKGLPKDSFGAGRKDNLLINDLLDKANPIGSSREKDAGLNNGLVKGRLQSGYKMRDKSKDIANKLAEKKNANAWEYAQKGGLGPNKDFVQENGLVVDIQKEFENYYKGIDARIGKGNKGHSSDRNVVNYKGTPKDFAPIKGTPGRGKPPPVNAPGPPLAENNKSPVHQNVPRGTVGGDNDRMKAAKRSYDAEIVRRDLEKHNPKVLELGNENQKKLVERLSKDKDILHREEPARKNISRDQINVNRSKDYQNFLPSSGYKDWDKAYHKPEQYQAPIVQQQQNFNVPKQAETPKPEHNKLPPNVPKIPTNGGNGLVRGSNNNFVRKSSNSNRDVAIGSPDKNVGFQNQNSGKCGGRESRGSKKSDRVNIFENDPNRNYFKPITAENRNSLCDSKVKGPKKSDKDMEIDMVAN